MENEKLIEIVSKLNEIEENHNVKILLAFLHGSRAYGCMSNDSDYDIRFIYIREPKWYLQLLSENRKYHIETFLENNVEYEGSDIKKFLSLFLKSCVVTFEWINSKLILCSKLHSKLKELSNDVFNPKYCIHHYKGMAKKLFQFDPQNNFNIPLKKYILCLRCILSAKYIEVHNTIPPIEFKKLIDTLPNELHERLYNILDLKVNNVDSTIHTNDYLINIFIKEELNRKYSIPEKDINLKNNLNNLNNLFIDTLLDEYGLSFER